MYDVTMIECDQKKIITINYNVRCLRNVSKQEIFNGKQQYK